MSETTDAVVIGAGVIGSAAAYYLAKAGLKVVLVDRGDVASGTSGACEGNIMAEDHEPGYDSMLTVRSNELYQQLTDELERDFEYHQIGCMFLIESITEWEFMEARHHRQRAVGLPVRMVNQDELLSRYPELAKDLLGAVESTFTASVNPINLCLALSAGIRKLGGRVQTFTEVLAIEKARGGSVAGVVTSGGRISAPIVVNAAGPWSPLVSQTIGIDIPVQPRRGQILVTEQMPVLVPKKMAESRYIVTKFHPELAAGSDDEASRYGIAFTYEPRPSGNLLIGSSREFVGYDTNVNCRAIGIMARRAIRFVPRLRYVSVIRTYAGLRPFMPDHMPIISKVEQIPGYFLATGHEGDGIGLAPLTGKLIAEMATGKQITVDIEPLSYSRLQKRSEGRH